MPDSNSNTGYQYLEIFASAQFVGICNGFWEILMGKLMGGVLSEHDFKDFRMGRICKVFGIVISG